MINLLEPNKKLQEDKKTRPSSHYLTRPVPAPCTNPQQNYRKIKTNLDRSSQKIWNQSASSMNRSRGPSYRISKAQRFSDINKDLLKNVQNLSLDLRTSFKKGCTFTKSQRIDHFIDTNKKHMPSPATYEKQRFLDKNDQNCKKLSGFCQQEKCVQQTMNYINTQVQPRQSHYINHIFKKNKKRWAKSSQKGATFSKFSNYQKLYTYHGRNMPYKSQLFAKNPGVGTYRSQRSFDSSIAKNRGKFSMGKILQRFNELGQKNTPSPLTYQTQTNIQDEKKSFCVKQTFPKSKRTYLTKPDNGTPGPAHYKNSN